MSISTTDTAEVLLGVTQLQNWELIYTIVYWLRGFTLHLQGGRKPSHEGRRQCIALIMGCTLIHAALKLKVST